MEKEEALLDRISLHHEKRAEITSDLQKCRAGFYGEQQLEYHLRFLPEKEYFIFHDLRLQIEDKVCQMDALVITPSVLIIIESKNFSGNLLYDQHINRLIRKYQNQEESFPDPIMQAKRQQIFLQLWLELHKFRSCPIEFLISLGQSTSIIKTNGRPDIFQKILYAEQIPQKVEKLNQLYSQKIYTPYRINKLLQALLAEHNPITINISKKYGISKKDYRCTVPALFNSANDPSQRLLVLLKLPSPFQWCPC